MKLMRFIGKIIGLLLLLVFLVVLPVTVWTFNIEQALFERSTYQQMLQSRTLYNGVLPTLVPRLIQGAEAAPDAPEDAPYAAQVFAGLDEQEWQQIIRLLMPPPWVQRQFQTNLNALFDWVDGPQIRPNLQLDLVELKSRMRGDEGQQVVSEVIENWPACTGPQQAQMQEALGGDSGIEGPLPSCWPSEEALQGRLTDRLNAAVANTVSEISDSVTLYAALRRAPTVQERLSWLFLKLGVRVVRRVAYLVFLIPLAILLLIEIATIRSFKSLFRWYGWAAFVGGLLCLSLPIDLYLLSLGQPAARRQALLLAAELVVQVSQWIMLHGAIITVAGLAMLVIARLIVPPIDADLLDDLSGTAREAA
jgi:hypothetical protein